MALFLYLLPYAYVERLKQGEQQERPPTGYRTEQASITTEITLISQTQHEKEELGWRWVAKQLAEEAEIVGKLEQFIKSAMCEISQLDA